MKKLLAIFVMLTMFLVVIAPDEADARRGGGGFKSPKKSFQSNPTKKTDNVQKSSNTSNTNKAANTNQKRGFFSGGGLMKGLMIGGLAGMLFGSLFAGMGFLGNILGLAINLLAVWVLIMVVMAIVRTVKQRRADAERRRNGMNP